MTKLTKSFLNKTGFTDKDKTYWDDRLKGFGLRVQGNTKSWIIMYRNIDGRLRKLTIGKTETLTPEEARQEAKNKLADVAKGKDPAKEKANAKKSTTIAELCDWYMEEGTAHKKASTLEIDKGRIKRHIKPLIGNRHVISINRGDIEKLMHDIIKGDKIKLIQKTKNKYGLSRVTGGKTAASRTVQLLGAILEFAKRRGIIENNPAHGIQKPKAEKKEVFLDIEGIKKLSLALHEAEKQGESRTAINATKLLLLTGCRKMEILSLRWEYIDLKNKCFRFPDTKSGKQTRAFGQGALNLLLEIKQDTVSEWVFPSGVNDGHLIGLPKAFRRIRKINDTESGKAYVGDDITLHTLRHSFASVGADMGFTELTIAGLLGHSLGGVTNRYSHNVDSSLVSAADKISLRIEKALEGKQETDNVVNLKRG